MVLCLKDLLHRACVGRLVTATTKKQRKERLDEIEKTMAEVGWSPRIIRDLADKWGCTTRTVYSYRKEVLEDLAACFRGETKKQDRAEFVTRLRERQRLALTDGSWGSVSSMMGIEAKVLGIEDTGSAESSETLVVVRPKVTT